MHNWGSGFPLPPSNMFQSLGKFQRYERWQSMVKYPAEDYKLWTISCLVSVLSDDRLVIFSVHNRDVRQSDVVYYATAWQLYGGDQSIDIAILFSVWNDSFIWKLCYSIWRCKYIYYFFIYFIYWPLYGRRRRRNNTV